MDCLRATGAARSKVAEYTQRIHSPTAKLHKGALSIANGNVGISAQKLSINGQGKVVGPLPYSVSLRGAQVKISELSAAFDLPQLADRILGEVDAVALIKGDAQIGLASVMVDVRSAKLLLDGEPIRNIHFTTSLPQSDGLNIELKSAEVAGGTLQGTMAWPSLADTNCLPQSVKLSLRNLSFRQLEHLRLPFTLGGVISGSINFGTRTLADRVDWDPEWRPFR